jgi:hypothetical protein
MSPLENEIAVVLRDRAAGVADSAVPYEAVRRRSRRVIVRRRVVALAAAVALVGGGGAATVPAAAPHPAPAVPDPALIDTHTWDLRGSLADDATARAQAAAKARVDCPPDAPVHLLYVGDTDAGRVVAAVVDLGGDSIMKFFAGPRGAAIGDLRPRDTPVLAGGTVLRNLYENGRWHAFILAAPGVGRAEVSWAVDYDRSGDPVRTWQRVGLVDGVGVIPIPQARPAATVRVSAAEPFYGVTSMASEGAGSLAILRYMLPPGWTEQPLPSTVDIRGAGRDDLTRLVNEVAAGIGVPVDRLGIEVTWASGTSALAVLTLPGGLRFVAFTGGSAASHAAYPVRPGQPPTYVALSNRDQRWIGVVIAPYAANGSATVTVDALNQATVHLDSGGFATVDAPGGTANVSLPTRPDEVGSPSIEIRDTSQRSFGRRSTVTPTMLDPFLLLRRP